MTITIDLSSEIERGLQAQAEARGVSLSDFVNEIVVREAHVPLSLIALTPRTGQALIDVSDPSSVGRDVAGYFSPEEWAQAVEDTVTLNEARVALSNIPGSLSEAVIAQREER